MNAVAADSFRREAWKSGERSRLEALLRSASLLLASGDHGEAVRALHAEIHRELGAAELPAPQSCASRREAEAYHRELSSRMVQRRASARGARWRSWSRRLPQWVSWAVVAIVVGGLQLRYLYARVERMRWQHQHPDGAWISRYYDDTDFKDFVLTRYDTEINYKWGRRPPAQAMARDHWSATWDTCLMVTSKLRLKLRLTADDSGKLILDGVQQMRTRHRRPQTKTLRIAPGAHHLRVEYKERRTGSKLQLQGLDFAGGTGYHFERPLLDGDSIRCGQLSTSPR